MQSRRWVGQCSVGLFLLAVSVTPAGAQFPAGKPASPPAPAAPPPVRKTVEDDGVSAYVVTDLGMLPDDAVASQTPPGTPSAWSQWQLDSVGGINKRGDVVLNFSGAAGGKRSGIYSAQTGRITVLPPTPGFPNANTYAFALSDDGKVLGMTNSADLALGRFHPVIWNGATRTNLLAQKDENGRPTDADDVDVYALSPDGRYAAGSIFLNGFGPTLALWHEGTLTHTRSLGQGQAHSCGVNNAGQVVGDAPPDYDEAPPSTFRVACLWANGSLSRLGGGLPGVNSGARAINADGVTAGWSDTQAGASADQTNIHAVRWRNGVLTDLGTLGGPVSTATGVDDAGQIVGFATSGPLSGGQAFLWENDRMRPLAALIPPGTGWSLGYTQINYGGEGNLVINARGQIAGVGRRDAQPRAFLLTPRSLIPKK